MKTVKLLPSKISRASAQVQVVYHNFLQLTAWKGQDAHHVTQLTVGYELTQTQLNSSHLQKHREVAFVLLQEWPHFKFSLQP